MATWHTVSCVGMWRIAERTSVKCHMLHDDRLSPEEARGTFLITTLCGEATGTWHGATSHLETAAACLATCASAVTDLPVPPQLSAQSSCTTCLLPWWDEHSCRRVAGVYTFELSAGAYSFDKYLLRLCGGQDRSLDSALKFGMEKTSHV